MNILIIASDFRPLLGGVSEYAYQLAKYLDIGGNKVTVLSPHREKDIEFDKTCAYKIYRYDAEAMYRLNKIGRFFEEYKLFSSLIKNEKIDIIISNHLCAYPSKYWIAAKLLRVPYCVFVYGMEAKADLHGIEGFKKRLLLKNASKIFCSSFFAKDCVIKLGIPAQKIKVAYPGVNTEDSERKKVSDGEFEASIKEDLSLKAKKVIFSLGRLIERKGQDTFIKSMPKILEQFPDAIYIIAGEGSYEAALRNLTQECNVRERVIFLGKITESQKRYYYNACDIFVMPNRELADGDVEGFGIVFLEANSYGKPVIGGRSGGTTEAIMDKQTGLLVNPTDIDDVAKAVICLLKNPDIAVSMGQRGRRMIEENFLWKDLAPKIEAELKDMVSR